MEDESVIPIELYEETVGVFSPNSPNRSRQETVRTLQAFQEPTLNSEEIPITSTLRSTLRYVNRSSAGDVTNPHPVAVTLTVTGRKFLKENKTGQKRHRNIGQHRVIFLG